MPQKEHNVLLSITDWKRQPPWLSNLDPINEMYENGRRQHDNADDDASSPLAGGDVGVPPVRIVSSSQPPMEHERLMMEEKGELR